MVIAEITPFSNAFTFDFFMNVYGLNGIIFELINCSMFFV